MCCLLTLSLSPLALTLSLSLSYYKRSQARRRKVEKQIKKEEMGSGSFLKVVAKNFDVLAGPFVTLVYPLYASVKAIETKSSVDDQQWLTYWVLYSLVTLFELTFAKVIEWLPFWPYAKLFFYCWLVLPYFSGAAYVYQQYVRPIFVNQQTVNIWYVPRKKDIFSRPDDVLVAAEKFIEENGPEAFEKLLNKNGKAGKAGKSKKGNRRVSFTEPEPEPERESKFWKNSEPERESKLWKNSHHFEEVEPEREPQPWQDNNFRIFDDDDRY